MYTVNGTQGGAGESASQEYERRRAKDEARIRQRWGRFGGIAVALSDERQSTRAWSIGAAGEEIVGARLDAIASERIRVLHDRRIPGSRANIDHLLVTPGGVWVIDAKRYRGRPELRIEGGYCVPELKR
ncbi:nuclease-related domain-containing protein [Agromyces laixinhei]|uniref:nuclease-related domain-containing protein n=1 Tax=Agromyces laixinhei TaxID=2585717 RepID=UPI001E2AE0E0|nr:nuclease-related domain-containing protein [Agromyces laixinhei]